MLGRPVCRLTQGVTARPVFRLCDIALPKVAPAFYCSLPAAVTSKASGLALGSTCENGSSTPAISLSGVK